MLRGNNGREKRCVKNVRIDSGFGVETMLLNVNAQSRIVKRKRRTRSEYNGFREKNEAEDHE